MDGVSFASDSNNSGKNTLRKGINFYGRAIRIANEVLDYNSMSGKEREYVNKNLICLI